MREQQYTEIAIADLSRWGGVAEIQPFMWPLALSKSPNFAGATCGAECRPADKYAERLGQASSPTQVTSKGYRTWQRVCRAISQQEAAKYGL